MYNAIVGSAIFV